MSKSSHRKGRRFRYRLEALAFAAAAAPLARLPRTVIEALSHGVAALAFDALRIRRATALRNLEQAFPQWSAAQRRRVARAAYRHAFLNFVEFVRPDLSQKVCEPDFVATVHPERLEQARANGAFIVAVGHLGNWELLAAYGRRVRLGLCVLYKPMHNPILDRRFLQIRRESGALYLSTRLSDRALLRAIKQAIAEKRAIVILGDQDARKRGIFVEFFGRPASTATGAATLALRHNLPILPVCGVRSGFGRFRIEYGHPIYPPDGGRTPENIHGLTQQIAHSLEEAVRLYPEQYFWFHRRWKTRPKRLNQKQDGGGREEEED